MTLSRRTFLAAGVASVARPAAAAPDTTRKFAFGPATAGDTPVSADTLYTTERGYGFEPGGAVVAGGNCLTSDRPFHFSLAVPVGNYTVTLTLGDAGGTSDTTVKAELRRLVLEGVATERGTVVTRVFAVNVRTPAFPGGEVRLKDREKKDEWRAWDDRLTLEFNGRRPCVSRVEVAPADVPTLYLLGDSTVCDQPHEPYASWGQMLPRFFGPGLAVSNQAESGESLRSSLAARRLDKVVAALRPGDALLLQYGHNDMKSVTADAYQADLKRFAAAARGKGATVALVTPVNRRTFQGAVVANSLKDFPAAVRTLAADDKLPLIDLHAMSKTLYEALGPERSGRLFKAGDGTHHNNYGAYQLAKCVVEGVRASGLDLARHLAADAKPFDPARPDPVERFDLPASPTTATAPPDGK